MEFAKELLNKELNNIYEHGLTAYITDEQKEVNWKRIKEIEDALFILNGVSGSNVRKVIDTGKYIGGSGFTQSNRNILNIEIHSFENYIGNCLKIGDKVDIVHYYG